MARGRSTGCGNHRGGAPGARVLEASRALRKSLPRHDDQVLGVVEEGDLCCRDIEDVGEVEEFRNGLDQHQIVATGVLVEPVHETVEIAVIGAAIAKPGEESTVELGPDCEVGKVDLPCSNSRAAGGLVGGPDAFARGKGVGDMSGEASTEVVWQTADADPVDLAGGVESRIDVALECEPGVETR